MFVLFLVIDDIRKMLMFSHNHLTSITTETNFETIGIVKMEDMGTLPFFSVHFKGH